MHFLVIPKSRDGLTQLSKAVDSNKALLGHLMFVAQQVAKEQVCARLVWAGITLLLPGGRGQPDFSDADVLSSSLPNSFEPVAQLCSFVGKPIRNIGERAMLSLGQVQRVGFER